MEKKWQDMSPEEKREERFARLLSAPGVQFQSPAAEAAYKANVKRLKDVIQLKKPDRVPVLILGTFMQPYLYKVTPYECMYEYDKLLFSYRNFLQDYQPDLYSSPAFIGSGKILEILDFKQYRWPGHGVSKDSGYQYVEGEYMLADEYETLINDPSDFWLRNWLPRVFGSLEPLKNITPFPYLWEVVGISGQMIPFGIPPVQDALKALLEAGNQAMEWIKQIQAFQIEATGMGLISSSGGASKAPFDILADTLRGTRAMLMDMYRCPDLVLKALERITPIYIKQGVDMTNQSGNPLVFIPLHKGADGFMSDEQFRKFYWPTLKELIIGLADEGCVPLLFCEGGYNSRLQYLAELPKGASFWIFDRTDMTEVKKLLGNTISIGGNVPSSLILTGTTEEVKKYCKNLIDVVGKDGGYVMSFGVALNEGKAENIHTMIDFTKEYGVYK